MSPHMSELIARVHQYADYLTELKTLDDRESAAKRQLCERTLAHLAVRMAARVQIDELKAGLGR